LLEVWQSLKPIVVDVLTDIIYVGGVIFIELLKTFFYALAPDAHLSQIVDVALGISELTLLFFFVAKFIDQVASVYKALKSLFGR
jgi:hypothetical protein